MTKRRILGSMLPNMAALALSIGLISQPGFGQQLPWMDTGLTAQVRTELLLRAMTLDDKIEQIAVLPSPNTELPGCGFTALGRHIEGIPKLLSRRSGRLTAATALGVATAFLSRPQPVFRPAQWELQRSTARSTSPGAQS